MADQETNQLLEAILLLLKRQTIYLDRQRRWLTAIADTVAKEPSLEPHLKGHPFYDLGRRPDVDNIDPILQTIDALIERLKD